jgi:hypothetical protein
MLRKAFAYSLWALRQNQIGMLRRFVHYTPRIIAPSIRIWMKEITH